MELPKEAATIESPHNSPPSMTTGRLPKRFTNTLLTGPAKRRGKTKGKMERAVQIDQTLHLNTNS